ncbi:MAG: PAS domain S-box protein, partial [Anaerolineales bacterium]|nr:PAS domain S-box protein [Anaerolineales bacterium]
MKISPTDADLRSEFTPFASGLYAGKPDIRAVQVFPKEGAVLVYPIEGNEATIERTLDDLIHDDRPDVRADIQRTIQTRQIVISGPYELRQGGLGMVARLAIYQEDTLLGLAVIILDMPPLLEASGLANPQPHIRLALKDSSGQILTGSGDVFSDNPVTYTIVLPDGEWELAAMPPDGWTASIRNSLRIFQWTGLLIIALATSLAYLITNRQARLTLAVQEHTDSLAVSMAKREQANEALRESEKLFSKIFIDSPIAISMVKLPGGKNVEVNVAWCKLTGFSREEAIGYDTGELKIFDHEERNRLIKEYSNQGYSRLVESEITTKSREKRNVLISSELITLKENQYILASVIDITERKQAEEKLRLSEERFRLLTEHIPAIVYIEEIRGETGRIHYISPQVISLLGIPPEKLMDGDFNVWEDHVHVDDRPGMRAEYRRCFENNDPFEYEYRMIASDGRIVWIHDQASTLQNIQDSSLLIRGVMYDITERKQAEEALRTSEYLRRMIIESEPECVKLVGRNGTLLEMNPAGLAMIEADRPEQVIGNSILNLIAPEWRTTFKQLNEKVFQGESVTAEFEIVGLCGSRRWMETHAVPLRDNVSTIIAQLAITRDITERKQAQEALLMRVNELSVLYKTSQSLQKLLTPESLSQEIVELLEKTLSYEYGAVLLIEEPGRRLMPFAIVGHERGEEFIKQDKELILSHAVSVGKGVTGWVAEHG